MAKVFTITEGLENLGALKTGGQGSVYKGKRMGEIFSAIKILPTPIYSENETDKNYTSFMNEVKKLKKVNEDPSPNIVRFLDAGITDTGNLPFIEMEYIEGPDLSELLTPPHDPIFTIKEVIKVCDQLSNALAHCHKAGVKHGDIKTNNVKYNRLTGNYILLDFGLSAMTDEQRRTSFRNAGAIEFMAPEQNEGKMLFETDVYSYGIIIYELLCGTVPFPLKDNGETSRNAVMVAHMEKSVPHPAVKRKAALPEHWSAEKKEAESKIPFWIINLLESCLQKFPENRFRNGLALYDFVCNNAAAVLPLTKSVAAASSPVQNLPPDTQEIIRQKDDRIASLERELQQKSEYIQRTTSDYYSTANSGKKVSKSGFMFLLLIALGLAAYIGYREFWNDSMFNADKLENEPAAVKQDTPLVQRNLEATAEVKQPVVNEAGTDEQPADSSDIYRMPPKATGDADNAAAYYKVNTIAHFFNKPEEVSRRNTFITYKDGFNIKPLDESGNFIYTEIETSSGILLTGWLKKDDLRKFNP